MDPKLIANTLMYLCGTLFVFAVVWMFIEYLGWLFRVHPHRFYPNRRYRRYMLMQITLGLFTLVLMITACLFLYYPEMFTDIFPGEK